MSQEIPVWRVSLGVRPGEWSLIPNGHLKPSGHEATTERLWSASVGSIVKEELASAAWPPYPPGDSEKSKYRISSKENLQPKPGGLGFFGDKDSGRSSKDLSLQKRGILAENSGLCNGSPTAVKRLKQFEDPSLKESNTRKGRLHLSSPYRQLRDDDINLCNVDASACLFHTASGKAVPISNAGMHQAMTMFGETKAFTPDDNQNEVNPKTATEDHVPSTHGGFNHKMNINMEAPCLLTRSVMRQHSTSMSPCLFQTAAGKAVSISDTGMHRAMALFDDVKTSNVDVNPSSNMFRTARGEALLVSSNAMKKAAQLLGEDNVTFPVEAPLPLSPSIKFMTGKGQSISVSSSAMKRARDLLAGDLGESTSLLTDDHLGDRAQRTSQRLFETSGGHLIKVSNGSIEKAKLLLKNRTSEITSMGDGISAVQNLGTDCIKMAAHPQPAKKGFQVLHSPLVSQPKPPYLGRKGAGPKKLVPSFKAPRRLQPSIPPPANPDLTQGPEFKFCKLVSMYPLDTRKKHRSSIEDFFGQRPLQVQKLGILTKEIEDMTSESAKHYKFSTNIQGLEWIGSNEFRLMLLETGANSQFATKEWVDNHFRWIVWKLTCLERSYLSKVANKLLTIQTVFDELRYRYEREVNCAQRSAIKKITEGDAAAGKMMVLCVAGVTINDHCGGTGGPQIEVTDGWYSLTAQLDPALSYQLRGGKIFVGQKLRICGAGLLGSTTPLPPLEAFQAIKLSLHINGTYRAHWKAKLGFCKGMPLPLAFHCIKPDGGLIPRTIIAIHRLYPLLYYERLPGHGSITRSARAEDMALRGYYDRRNQVAEEAVVQLEKNCSTLLPENDMDEGAKLFRLLENTAEPEILMADMTSAQHSAFAAYQAKRQAARQTLTERTILKALGEVHLDTREVTPFMKVSVVGLQFIGHEKRTADSSTCEPREVGRSSREGIVTIWHITQEQADNLKEGGVYCVSDLCPAHGRSTHLSRSGVLQLRATKSTTWQLLPQAKLSTFAPRRPFCLTSLGTLPFRREFDIAVLVVHVGKPYVCGFQKRQWLFASDGSVEENLSKESGTMVSLLAIDLSTSCEAFLPVERSLEGCVIGYCNLVKRCRDQKNCMWVAEASETSVFSSNLGSQTFLHLKSAADNVKSWAKASPESIAELENRIHIAMAAGS